MNIEIKAEIKFTKRLDFSSADNGKQHSGPCHACHPTFELQSFNLYDQPILGPLIYIIVHFYSLSVFNVDNGLHSRSALYSQTSGAALFCLGVTLFGSNEMLSLAAVSECCLVFVFWRHLQLADTLSDAGFLGRVAQVQMLLLRQVELLRSED